MLKPIFLLILSNLFMTFAWYGHLKNMSGKPLYFVILMSWGIAFFEYTLQVPANRMGSRYYNIGQLKVMQEMITMCIFPMFAFFLHETTSEAGLLMGWTLFNWSGLFHVSRRDA